MIVLPALWDAIDALVTNIEFAIQGLSKKMVAVETAAMLPGPQVVGYDLATAVCRGHRRRSTQKVSC